MKKLFLFSLVLFMFMGIFSASVIGQNKCTMGNTTIYSSENIHFIQVGENKLFSYTSDNQKATLPENRDLYTLIIEPSFEAHIFCISDGLEYQEVLETSSIYADYPEGHYTIAIFGVDESYNSILLSYEIDLHENTEMHPETSEANQQLYFDAHDENGSSFDDLTIYNGDTYYTFVWFDGHMISTIEGGLIQLSGTAGYYYNTIPENCFFQITTIAQVEGQKSYLIEFNHITTDSNPCITNNPEDLVATKAHFNLNNPDSCYFQGNWRIDGGDKGWELHFNGWHVDEHFDPSLPLNIITNCKDEHPGEFGPQEWKYRFIPMVYESFDMYMLTPREFHDEMLLSAIYINSDGMMVREPFDDIMSNPWNAMYHQSALNHYPMTPAQIVFDPNQTYYYGFRTPIWYFQGLGFGSDGPVGIPFYGGIFNAFGEGGVQRLTDTDNSVIVKLDGETIYEDFIFNFNDQWTFAAPDEGVITMDIKDDHVENEGLVMTNKSHVEFDLRKEEAFPPTLTILQVMDENNNERIDIQDLSNSKINIAAGDFTIDLEEMHMVYVDKPEMEVWYAIDGGEYQPLEAYEDESMFHVNYGNFFVVDLDQLEGIANDKWVSLKVTVTDAQGNFQTQELDNLFYAGEITSIDDHVMLNLTHTVCPNPFNGEMKISAVQAVNGEANIVVYNMLGEQVYNKVENCTETQDFTIDGSAWKPGVYFYSISTESGVLQGKVVKE